MGNIWFVQPIDCNVKHPHFPKHKFPIHATRNVQTQLKSNVTRRSTDKVQTDTYVCTYIHTTYVHTYTLQLA